MAYLGNSPINRLYSTQAIVLSQGQTAVNVNYTPGLTLFFRDGALLEPGTDYTASDGSVVTLAQPANAGDVLQVISLAQFAVSNALALAGGMMSGPIALFGADTINVDPAASDNSTKLPSTKWIWNNIQALVSSCIEAVAAAAGFATLFGANGYIRFPSWLGGLMLQWGKTGSFPADATNYTIGFSTSFPNTCLSVVMTDYALNSTAAVPKLSAVTSASFTASQFQVQGSSTGHSYFYVAIGN